MENTNSIKYSIKHSKVPVIIFGASYIGKLALQFCEQNSITVTCFCDNNAHKKGKQVLGTKILSVTDVPRLFPEAFFLIAVTDIQDVVKQLNQLGYSNWCGAGSLLQDYQWNANAYDFKNIKVNHPRNYGKYMLGTCLRSHFNYSQRNNLYIRSIDLVITEKCSLKCKDCANLMQYFSHPKNCDTTKVIKSAKLLADICDEINEIRIIGGEPFMDRDWVEIVEEIKKISNINYIIIYTNGTIVPKEDELKCLQEDNVFVNITDYGQISKNADALMQALDANGINYFYYQAKGWTACGSIKKRNRSLEQGKEVFARCCAKNLITFVEGKVFRCPFVASLERLIEITEINSDYVDLFEIKDIKSEKDVCKEKLKEYLYDIDILKACDYCSGRFLSDSEIEPGIQTLKPLKIKL